MTMVGGNCNNDKGLPSNGIIVSADDFVVPPWWNSLRPQKTKAVKNPLATLIPMTDITGDSCDRQLTNLNCIRNGDERKARLETRQYVLNVNYAGNEMESHVRVIFETSKARSIEKMEHYCASGSTDKDDDTPLCLFFLRLLSLGLTKALDC